MSEVEEDMKARKDYLAFLESLPRSTRKAMIAKAKPSPPSAPSEIERLTGEVSKLLAALQLKTDTLTQKQRDILKLLQDDVLTGSELAQKLDCDLAQLHRRHLKPLMKMGRVKNDRKIGGYYRPDAPPK